MRYFDVHAHVFPEELAPKAVAFLEDYYGSKWSGRGTVADLSESMRRYSVERAVIFSSATKAEQVRNINDFLNSEADKSEGRMIALGTLHPDTPDVDAEIERIRLKGLRGIKFHPDFQSVAIDDIRMLRIYEKIGDTLPIIFHTGDKTSDFSSPQRLAGVLDKMPFLRVIAAHFGGYSRWDEARECLIGRDLYIDTSSSLPLLSAEEAAEMVRKHGADRVLFASDYPAASYEKAIKDVLDLGLTEDDNEKIFFRNAETLFL
jgi:predicted TIM-barrel fold metal-dependent hydrolase